ncbi:MAG: hypothetical protein ACFKPT_22260 [Gloeotrichia echinulata GP01]
MSESFSQAAARHLHDANLLLNKQRCDNAVYLAGYVVECSFKVLVEIYIDKAAVKKYGHDLVELQGTAMERLRLMYPILDIQLPASRITGTVLVDEAHPERSHPERRYQESGLWSYCQAKEAVERSEQIYTEIVPRLILDGILSSKEL